MTAPDALTEAARLLAEAMVTLDTVVDHTAAASGERLTALAAAAHAQHALDTLLRGSQSGLPSLSR